MTLETFRAHKTWLPLQMKMNVNEQVIKAKSGYLTIFPGTPIDPSSPVSPAGPGGPYKRNHHYKSYFKPS